ncbi:AraC family transcriptional regulator [Allorhizobium pseudoryzae]|uniref:AraC family transcriptional regulator n=1 Tax=Allorhizobium pseudoryzae TaxID=379684 RepID=UPI003CFF24CC
MKALDERIVEERALVAGWPTEKGKRRTAFPPVMLDDPRLTRAVRFLERTPAGRIVLEDVAAEVGLSPFHFQRVFQEVMGESPSAYLRRTRLDRAAMNLQMSQLSITSIALNAGYSSPEAFVRGFFSQFGEVPSEFRQKARELLPTASGIAAPPAIPVVTQQRQPVRLLAMRFHGPMPQFQEHWQQFKAYLEDKGLFRDDLQAVSIFFDTPMITPPGLYRHDCAVIDTGQDWSGTGLYPHDFPEGRYVNIRHTGNYDHVLGTYAWVSIDWINQTGEAFSPDSNGGYEFHHTAPWAPTGSIRDLDIVLPLDF